MQLEDNLVTHASRPQLHRLPGCIKLQHCQLLLADHTPFQTLCRCLSGSQMALATPAKPQGHLHAKASCGLEFVVTRGTVAPAR